MRVMLDQNLSFRLVGELKNIIPHLTHVKFEGLLNEDDYQIWQYAKTHSLAILTFDADFYEIQTIKGFPPKIIWLRFGNLTRPEFLRFLKKRLPLLRSF